MTSINSPSSASASATTLPSPPSAMGLTVTSSISPAKASMPSFTALPASRELKEPLKESIAIRIFIMFSFLARLVF